MRSLNRIISIIFFSLAVAWSAAGLAANRRYYVAVNGTGDGTSWKTATSLLNALNNAEEGDTVWVRGYVNLSKDSVYAVPASLKETGFKVNAGVMIYGGFSGTETSENQRTLIDGRANRFKYVSVVTGDVDLSDTISTTSSDLIYPDDNKSRANNAYHVFTLNLSGAANNSTTIINGITIGGGSANATIAGDGQHGGGMLIKGSGSAFHIEKCMFINNYAVLGGAVYIDSSVSSTTESIINGCIVFNNVAGSRQEDSNSGGGLYIAGNATVVNTAIYNNERGGVYLKGTGGKIINSTIANNSSAAVDYHNGTNQYYGTETTSDASNVINCVLWGNTTLAYDSIGGKRPILDHSAYYFPTETEQGNGCINISKNNREGTAKTAPCFTSPSPTAGFDRSYDWLNQSYPLWAWDLEYDSKLIDYGDNSAYATLYGDYDIMGDKRKSGSTIDIGAYEYVQVEESHRRYVKTGGKDSNDGLSWGNAMANPQTAIDDLYSKYPGEKCEVWVAAGEYTPQSYWKVGQSTLTFLMRDGISVYGGFVGSETKLSDRTKGTLPWSFTNETILQGVNFDDTSTSWAENRWQWNSESTHVVWFGPEPKENDTIPSPTDIVPEPKKGGLISSFTHITYLDGFTIEGGNASGSSDLYRSDCGGGVIMLGSNTRLANCVVRRCSADSNGGGVYSLGGRVEGCLVHSNGADEDGGGVYVDEIGMVTRSYVTNNAAKNGGAIYLNHPTDGKCSIEAESAAKNYLLVATSLVSQNTNRENGAIYANGGGIVEQSTIVNNATVRATDEVDAEASRTGGLFITNYCYVLNTFLGGNAVGGANAYADNTLLETAQMYVNDPDVDSVRFYNCAITAVNYSPWNNVYQSETVELPEYTVGTYFSDVSDIAKLYGVQSTWPTTNHDFTQNYWRPTTGSNIIHRGLNINLFPSTVILKPERDIASNVFEKTPTIGANKGDLNSITPTYTKNAFNIYIEAEPKSFDGDGSSWKKSYPSLSAVLDEVVTWEVGTTVSCANGDSTVQIGDTIKIHVLEGDLHPRYNYANSDPKSASVIVNACDSKLNLVIVGGYSAAKPSKRNPSEYRSDFNGHNETGNYDGGVYHVVTVQPGAKVTFDGVAFTDGSAVGSALRQQGAGLYIYAGADVTLRNCIFENNCAGKNGAALYAAPSSTNADTKVTMINCVVNNNSNRDEDSDGYVIKVEGTLKVNHVTVVNNHGKAPSQVSSTNNSFAAGNVSSSTGKQYAVNYGNTLELATLGADGAKNFSNPTSKVGFVYSGNTYYGGNSVFRPLTSVISADSVINKSIINKGSTSTDVTTDIVGNPRNLGGVPDLGAYEAELPKSGYTYYVRTNGSDSNTGLSWQTAFATVRKAVNTAYNSSVTIDDEGHKPQVWVAAGTYTQDPENSSDNCFDILDGVNVYGAFPATGNPGMDERHPLVSSVIYVTGDYMAADYETILKPKSTSTGTGVVRRVLGQADVCNPILDEGKYSSLNLSYTAFSHTTRWDGFTLRDGYIDSKYINFLNTNDGRRNGGAGATVFENVTLANSVVYNNTNTSSDRGYELRGGGVYCDRGTLVNCYIVNNTLGASESGWSYNYKEGQYTAYGGGGYMYLKSTMYNCVIYGNKTLGRHTDGAAFFIEGGSFYNNTIVNNTSEGTTRGNGGICVYNKASESDSNAKLVIYNCISIGNTGFTGSLGGNKDVGSNGGKMECYNSLLSSKSLSGSNVTIDSSCKIFTSSIFKNYDSSDFTKCNLRLNGTSGTVNMGDNYPNGINLSTYKDMDYTDRIKVCTIDAGAYEYTPDENFIQPETTKATDGTVTKAVYYVTYPGNGTANGSSVGTAACKSMLQDVLTTAGKYYKTNKVETVVKVAGYESSTGNYSGVYNANTLANDSNVTSYTFVVPNGVKLEGGYSEDFTERNTFKYKTILSPLSPDGVQGHHVVTFGSWPTSSRLANYDNDKAVADSAIIDGVWLTGGVATEKDGWNGIGGGAVVPKNAHVRNCVVEDCQATDGAGLYLLPGAAVSGTLIRNNIASGEGGGIYGAEGTKSNDGDDYLTSFVVSCTIVKNEAKTGGGVRHEKKSLVMNNDIVWGNTATTDKQISADYSNEFSETVTTGKQQYKKETTVYPYSDCFVMAYDGLKSTTRNTTMTSDSTTYFLDGTDFIPRTYSPLLNMGVENRYQLDFWEALLHATTYDMRGVERIEAAYRSYQYERITPGAFAVNVAQPDTTTNIFTRLFVSQGGGAYFNVYSTDGGNNWIDADAEYLSTRKTAKQWCVGRSFYTPFNSLGAALDYIREVRETFSKDSVGAYKQKGGVLDANTHFEIFMADGEYKPTRRRKHAHTAESEENNEVNNSFSIPENVSIYGGFSSTDLYADFEAITPTNKTYDEDDKDAVKSILGLTSTTTVTLGVKNDDGTEPKAICTLNRKVHNKADNGEYADLAGILYKRNLKEQMSDLNTNSLLEPWGFKNQTILSGAINGVENVHHVVYSEAAYHPADDSHPATEDSYYKYDNKYGVSLDGITITGGKTSATLTDSLGGVDVSEVGHGGAIFSDNVNYTLTRCRIVGNEGVHGGGVCVKGGTLNVISSVFGANKAKEIKISSTNSTDESNQTLGGAVKVEYENQRGAFNAVNSLFTNNEADGSSAYGGAIYVSKDCKMSIMNCIVARNKAENDPAVTAFLSTDSITNTVLWGNEGTEKTAEANVIHCASDVVGKLVTIDDASNGNIQLSTTNMDLTGPRFKEPSTVTGVEGNKTSAKWNPVGITILTDAGTGEITYEDGVVKAQKTDVNGKDMEVASGVYHDWWADSDKLLPNYLKVKADTLNAEYILSDVGNGHTIYYRYNGPKNTKSPTDQVNQQMSKVIDIGVYEFQYLFDFSQYNAVYVDTEDHGTGDGTSWVNATSDLRSAVMALANPKGTTEGEHFERHVYVRDGEYFSPLIAGGAAYSIYAAGDNEWLDSLAIMGACTGKTVTKNGKTVEEQDFSKQTVLIPNPSKVNQTKTLFSVNIQDMDKNDSEGKPYHSNEVPISISGFTFRNDGANAENAMSVTKVGTKSKFILKNSAFRYNKAEGLEMSKGGNTGEVLLYNVLFADGKGTGLVPDGKTTVVNATFANNTTDMSVVPFTESSDYCVYNTVSWNKEDGKRNLVTDDTDHKNLNLGNNENTDVMIGPMFVDPDNGDYNIEPSHMLLNTGESTQYATLVGTVPSLDVDLANATRCVDDGIDIGAYEYQGVLSPIIYVRSGLATTGDGTSWDKALDDLQEAANLAGLYYDKEKTTGYVFANRNVDETNLDITIPGAKIYGGMDLQETDEENKTTDEIVAALLAERTGVIENTQMSTISNLKFNANAVLDGFKISGDVTLTKGNLFTSVVEGNVKGGGEKSASLLYNTLVMGNVENVDTVVNVTATGTVSGTVVDDNIDAATTNGYVTADYWNYQLKETSEYIDKGNGTYTDIMMKHAGHEVDLAGNKRIRNTVDNGCFETWYLYEGTANKANADDYPHGKSVVYVMKDGTELKLDKDFYTTDNAFNPGFLLLDHHAGLRGMGSTVALTNFALDRDVEAGGLSLINMPFDVTSITNTSGVAIKRYNGNTRAANAYKYNKDNSTAWEDGTTMAQTTEGAFPGRLLDNTAGTEAATVRFYGSSYEENDEAKSVVLTQYNHIEAWPADNSKKFTHKENMGWNIFGSPYLCAMNFRDMEYGRVMYYGDQFTALTTVLGTKSADSYNKTLGGYVPMGDGLFTQTATLKTTETFEVEHSDSRVGEEYTVTPDENVVVVLTKAATRAADASAAYDEMRLNAVAAKQSRSDFDISADGVKWMTTDSVPQLYAEQNGGRYSLLSAVNIDGVVPVGVTLPESGQFAFSLAGDFDPEKYESIILKDAQTATAVDLLESDYEFSTLEAGDISGRFTIVFNQKMSDKTTAIQVFSPQRSHVLVTGTQDGDIITTYSANGSMVAKVEAQSTDCEFVANITDVAIVEVVRDGKTIAVKKVRMK